jgi:hypothetical protein
MLESKPRSPKGEDVTTPAMTPDVIRRYFDVSAERDTDAILALFADDATVVDESKSRNGKAEIREWREGVATAYTYTTELFSTDALGPNRYVIAGRLTGDFPGGVAELKWDFTLTEGRITRLVIAP